MPRALSPAVEAAPELRTAVARAASFLVSLQGADGSWRGDYGGPRFLLPMYIAAAHICGRELDASTRDGMLRSLLRAADHQGAVGIHSEAREGSLFATVLTYVAARLLGVSRDDAVAVRMRGWIRAQGGATGAASWGKWFLALLNLYDYDGLAPVQPELYLLPYAVPFHPGRFWCHARQVYLPMAYLYAVRARKAEDALTRELREEIYAEPYARIDFASCRLHTAPCDRLEPVRPLGRAAVRLAGWYEAVHSRRVRARACEVVLEHIRAEDASTHFIRIGPVNAVLNTLVHFFHDPDGEELRRSWETLPQYLWRDGDAISMNGYNSCATWDTAFAVQALAASGEGAAHETALAGAHRFLAAQQVLDDPPERDRYFRHPSRGGWPFSDRAHGWPISDCTAEGLKCALAQSTGERIPDELLLAAVRLILSWQNRDGGWATYEKTRGGRWLEQLNVSESFSRIVIDYSYPECTSACMQALSEAHGRFSRELDGAIANAVARGERFLRAQQRPDGSWEGSWGVCFTYGTWFAVAGVRAAGASPDDPAIARACDFLALRQNGDGGWGEDYRSCTERRWVPRASHCVQTAWALLTLVDGGRAGSTAAARAAAFLAARQQPDGDWPREMLPGVFNRTTLINYENYRRYFCLRALAAYEVSRPEPAAALGH